MALMMIAGRTFMHRVEMQVAMALGASVQPFTKITPSVSSTVTAMMGLLATWATKVANETSKISRFLCVTHALACARAYNTAIF